MLDRLKKLGIAAAVAASSMTLGTAAEARDRYRDNNNDAVIAIGAGIVGLAIGAALADRDDDRYYDRQYYPRRRYVRVSGYPDYYYYYQGNPNRYYRDRYYARNYRAYSDRRNYNRRYQGRRQYDAYYGRDRYDRRGYRQEYRQNKREYRRDYRDDRRDYRRRYRD